MINQFRGEYFFLSNFFQSPIIYKGISYKNNEAAFQAQKVNSPGEQSEFSNLTPADAKRKGRRVKLRKDVDWDVVKTTYMYEIVKAKFMQNAELRIKLIETGNEHLEEGNTCGDRIWGTVNGVGQNRLGKILMRVREELR